MSPSGNVGKVVNGLLLLDWRVSCVARAEDARLSRPEECWRRMSSSI